MITSTNTKPKLYFNPPVAGVDALPKGISNFYLEWEDLLFQTNFLAVGSFLGHLSMEKIFRLVLPSWS